MYHFHSTLLHNIEEDKNGTLFKKVKNILTHFTLKQQNYSEDQISGTTLYFKSEIIASDDSTSSEPSSEIKCFSAWAASGWGLEADLELLMSDTSRT